MFNITRTQLQSFIKDSRALKTFEELFKQATVTTPNDLEGVSNAADMANASANESLALLQSIKDNLEFIITEANNQIDKTLKLDYIDFNAYAPHANISRRVDWNETLGTLNIHHNNIVSQQVGFDTFVLIKNNSSSTINNGEVIYISGFDGTYKIGSKFISDGSINGSKLIGIATEDILNGNTGIINLVGDVNDINTTGSLYGETWLSGDILYASTSISGGLTKNKPTAPNLSIPLGIVVTVDATNGSIFVNPVIEQQKFYGSFEKTTSTSPLAINTAYPITLDNTIISSGVSIGTPTSRIVIANAGLYSISTSYQWESGSASAKNIKMWYRKNGVDVAGSTMQITMVSNQEIKQAARKRLFSLNAGDYIELYYSSDSIDVSLFPIAATAWSPSSVAFTVTVEQIQQ